jgi:hypothetical protein
MMTPGPTKEAKTPTQMTNRTKKPCVDAEVPYSHTARVLMPRNAMMMYAPTVITALTMRLQNKIWSVAARFRRLEMATRTPPDPMPSSASPMIR